MDGDIRLTSLLIGQKERLRSLRGRIHNAVSVSDNDHFISDEVDIEEESDMFGFSMIDTYDESTESTIDKMKNNRNFENPESIRSLILIHLRKTIELISFFL